MGRITLNNLAKVGVNRCVLGDLRVKLLGEGLKLRTRKTK
jgi:hypothetical protein